MKQKNYLLPLIVFVISIAGYLRTMCPTVHVGDNGEFIAASCVLGVAHPPGYPLYCVIGKAFSFLPMDAFAFRINFVSAFFAAAASAVLCIILLKMFIEMNGNSIAWKEIVALAASLTFTFSSNIWSQATTILKVYCFHTFLVACIILILLEWRRLILSALPNSGSYRTDMLILLLSFLWGFSLTNHHTTILLGPAGVGYIIWQRWVKYPQTFRGWHIYKLFLLASLLFFAGFTFNLYIPIRALSQPPLNWGNPDSLSKLYDHLSRKQYGTLLVQPYSITSFVNQVKVHLTLLWQQFHWIAFPLASAGLFRLYRADFRFFWFMVATFLSSNLGFSLLVNYQTDVMSIEMNKVFFTQSYLIFSVWIGFGSLWLFEQAKRCTGILTGKTAFGATAFVVLLLPVLTFTDNFIDNDQSYNMMAKNYGLTEMHLLDPDAVLFTAGDNAPFILAYYQMVEKRRTDVSIFDHCGTVFNNIYGERFSEWGTFMQNKRRKQLQEKWMDATPGRPVYFTIGGNISEFTGRTFAFCGPLIRYIRNGEEKPKKCFWKGDSLEGVADPILTGDYLTRDIINQYFYSLGEYFMSKKMTKLGEYHYAMASSVGLKIDALQCNIGNAFLFRGMDDRALAEYQKVLKLNPNNFTASANISTIFLRHGKIDEAIVQAKDALKINPNHSTALYNLAAAYLQKGMYQDAIEPLQKDLRQEPDNSGALSNLGVAYIYTNRFSDAVDVLRKAVKLEPKDVANHTNLGMAYQQLNLYESAINEYLTAIQISDDAIDAHNNLGSIYGNLGRKDLEAGRIAEGTKKLNQAMDEWQKILKMAPGHPRATANLQEARRILSSIGIRQ